MFLYILQIFLVYLLLSIILSGLIKIIPEPIRAPFEELVRSIRLAITRYVNSIFRQEDNFEVNILSRFLVPFIGLLFIYALLTTVIIEGNYEIIDIFLWIINVFVLMFLAPSAEDVQHLLNNRTETVFVFMLKVFVILQLLDLDLVYGDLITMTIAIFPLSTLLPYEYNTTIPLESGSPTAAK